MGMSQGNMGPGMTSHGMQPQMSLAFELQQCQQQLQQLYKMPQNVQTQQKVSIISFVLSFCFSS